MKRARITWTDSKGTEHTVTATLGDWLAWEKHTGKSVHGGVEQLYDIAWLGWSAARRDGEKRKFDDWVEDMAGFPDAEWLDDEGPTRPGA